MKIPGKRIDMAWTTTKIESWNKFLELVDSTKVHETTLPKWVFRGQANSSWALVPSLQRKLNFYKISTKKALGIEKQIYREFITKFRLYYTHEIPKYENFNTINYFAMMQHYSCPTRLLDWTNSPFIAMYFAVESCIERDGAVFLFNESRIEKIVNQKYTNFIDLEEEDFFSNNNTNSIYTAFTAFQTERNIFQQGLFTISPNIMGDHEKIIDDLFCESDLSGYHHKFIIPKEMKIEFLARLKSMNISADILYRNLDGLGRSLSHLVDVRGWGY